MTTHKPVNCRYFYGDYFRGKEKEACRLLESTPGSRTAWKRKLCDTCPIPELLLTSSCRDLLLEGKVTKSFLRERVAVSFAICVTHMLDLDDPAHCPQCEAEWKGNKGSF